MSYLPMTEYETASPEVRAEYDDQIAKHGRITNMKRTLLHNVPAFKAYMEWYTLYDEIRPFLGDRALQLFSYAISEGNDCLICSTFFRQILIDAGDDPDHPVLSDTEQLLFDKLKDKFSDEQIVLLISFAGIMYATNLFNTVAKVPLDSILYDYRKNKEKE